MRRLVATLVGVAAVGVPAHGQEDANLGAIYLCNEVVLRIRAAAAGQTVEQRREAVRLRLVQAYATERMSPENITLRQVPGGWAIYVGQQLIITVTPQDGQANRTTADALAQTWLARLRDLLPRCRLEAPPGVRP